MCIKTIVLFIAYLKLLLAQQFDGKECGKSKACFVPKESQCYMGCNGMGSAYQVFNASFIQFELFANDSKGVNSYVALGFSLDEKMGKDSVLECSQIGNGSLSMKFSYNQDKTETGNGEPANVRIANEETIRSQYIVNTFASYANGQMYCRALVRVSGYLGDPHVFTYNPNQEYFLLMANGPTANDSLASHTHVATSNARLLSQIFPGIDLSTCGSEKGCFEPVQCKNMNGLVGTYRMVNDTYLLVEITGKQVDLNTGYISMAFSNDNFSGNEIVVDCLNVGTAGWSVRLTYRGQSVTSPFVGDNSTSSIFQNKTFNNENGAIYCSAMIAVVNSTINSTVLQFDKDKKYQIRLSGGKVDPNGHKSVERNCTSTASTYLSNYRDQFDVSECGKIKTCFIPNESDCVIGCNGIAMAYKILSNSTMQLELTANSHKKEAWVAVGFSTDSGMGNESVIECSALAGQDVSMKFSYNNNTPSNERIQGDYTTYFAGVTAQFVDGVLYCRATVTISGANDTRVFKYDPNQLYYLLLANGPTTSTGLDVHKHSAKSFQRRLNDSDPKAPTQNYGPLDVSGCGKSKACYLGPSGTAVSYVFSDPTTMKIELVSTAMNVKYAAVAFNLNPGMANSNVIECSILGNSPASMKFSYNDGDPTNVRIAKEETIRSAMIMNSVASLVDGAIYCTGVVNVSGSSVSEQIFKYDKSKMYRILVASGPTGTDGLLYHSSKSASEPRNLTELLTNTPVTASGISATTRHQLVLAHAVLMILAWLFFIPTAVMFARFLRSSWARTQPFGSKIWFHVHRVCNTLGILMVIGAAACISTAKDFKWTGPGSNSGRWYETHSLIGLIAMLLAFLQPFISLLRCSPDSSNRPIFNWIHRLIGLSAFILATTAIAIAVDHFSMVNNEVWGLVFTFVPLTVLFGLIFIFLLVGCCLDDDSDGVLLIREIVVFIALVLFLAAAVALVAFVIIGK